MSLLMEALKKAEEAKRLASEGNAPETTSPAAPELTLQPVNPPTSPPNSPLPDLSLHINSVDADLAAVSTEGPAKRKAPASLSGQTAPIHREATERTAARNVFSAKQSPKSRTGLWLFLGLGGVVALGLGGYFWWQLQAVSGGSLTRATTQPLPSVPPVIPAAPVPAPGPGIAATEAEKLQPENMLPQEPPTRRALPESPPNERPTRTQKPPPVASQAAPDSPVRLSKNQPKPNQTIERAYEALQTGRLDEAQHGYEQVLRNDAKNTDALLGLATIAARQGQTERAQAFYQYALESDPNDATAQAGVINAKGQANPELSESRLKTALASQPDSSALHLALGNLYARQGRWSEAQQSYFRAYSTEPDNADFIFNLAVSLDHLHQNKLAAQYYQMAITAAGTRSFSFDRNQVKNRLLELQP